MQTHQARVERIWLLEERRKQENKKTNTNALIFFQSTDAAITWNWFISGYSKLVYITAKKVMWYIYENLISVLMWLCQREPLLILKFASSISLHLLSYLNGSNAFCINVNLEVNFWHWLKIVDIYMLRLCF